MPADLITTVMSFVVIAAVFAFRWRRIGRVRPLKLQRLWILPALYAAVVVATFVAVPPRGWTIVLCGVAGLAGAALGWRRGRMMRIEVDTGTQALRHAGSPAALALLFGIVLLRQIAVAGGVRLGIDAMAVTDVAMSLLLGLFTVQRVEMFGRGRRLLAAAATA